MRQLGKTKRFGAALCRGLALASLVALAGCGGTVTRHGQIFTETDLQAVQPGMSQDQVRAALGTPATTAVIGDGHAYYYISSTDTQASFFLPTEQSRQVVAVYFNQGGTVDKVANYGLKDGKVFDFVSRTTPAPGGKDEGILKQLFRNLGKQQLFGAGSAFGSGQY
ncbi:outer membrane protein assembly factor BamE [Hyphomicrobium sp.]|jgi:outer membrane protein assembly factor BamE (lipoprotein component of BamABCDE complex)|uniref:outer membrane protein assembly factor BamE n=1 Tax=Hyphomicrobium sp. TaxID=82 RepID=UPI002C338EB4|nr:outer membrane protein assembly factor BamE [Hyphomicrobium sp.]HVZ04286.1 outer membrane protein assembly factor BamE [Hyphomicrobium sp.]